MEIQNNSMEILNNGMVLLTITFAVYYASRQIQKRTGWLFLNPIIVTMTVMIALLKITGVSYETYNEGGHFIEFWLKPSIVALAVPLYQQLGDIKRQLVPIIISQFAGCITGIVSVVIIANALGASPEIIASLAPKSVTTPIAMEVCNALGGIPSLTAAIVIIVGLFGAVCGFKVLEVWHVKNPYSQGLSLGTASHAIGTSMAMEKSKLYGTYASLGLILNGILTAILAPWIVKLMGV